MVCTMRLQGYRENKYEFVAKTQFLYPKEMLLKIKKEFAQSVSFCLKLSTNVNNVDIKLSEVDLKRDLVWHC